MAAGLEKQRTLQPPDGTAQKTSGRLRCGCRVRLHHGASRAAVRAKTASCPEEGRRCSWGRACADESERDAFYVSPMFKAWDEKARALTEGEPVYRQLHGLEAWFRSPNPPPRWKMAVATFLGVFPTAMILNLTIGPAIGSWPFLVANAVFNACIVALLTWVVMPLITRALQ